MPGHPTDDDASPQDGCHMNNLPDDFGKKDGLQWVD